jgi:pyridoxamine 5'-phosphate oxidase
MVNRDLSDLREDYRFSELLEKTLENNPFKQFEIWFNDAVNSSIYEPNAMTISTISKTLKPSSRVVLLKEFTTDGFVFFTNYLSNKAKDIENNNNVALNFFWAELQRQIRIEGSISKISKAKSEEYFKSRPRESQLGAITSIQSSIIKNRDEIETKYKEIESLYEGKEIEMPEHWGGYIVKPERFEFWQGRTSRLHDRIQFELINDSWIISRLSP